MFFNLNKFSGLGFVGRNLVCYLVEHDLCSKVNNCKWRNSLDHHFENFDNNINQPFFIMCFCNKCNFLILIGSKHKQQVCMKLNWHLLDIEFWQVPIFKRHIGYTYINQRFLSSLVLFIKSFNGITWQRNLRAESCRVITLEIWHINHGLHN